MYHQLNQNTSQLYKFIDSEMNTKLCNGGDDEDNEDIAMCF